MYRYIFYNHGWWVEIENYIDLLNYKLSIQNEVWESVLEDIGVSDYYNWDKYKNVQEASIAQAILMHGRNMVEKKETPVSISAAFISIYNENLENQMEFLSKNKPIYINAVGGWNASVKSSIYEFRDTFDFQKQLESDIKIVKIYARCYEVYLRTAIVRNDCFSSFFSNNDAKIVAKYLYLKREREKMCQDELNIVKRYGFL